jgi:hypothetical protein
VCDLDFVVQKGSQKSVESAAANSYVHQQWAVIDNEEQAEVIARAGGTAVTEQNFRMLYDANPRMRCLHCAKTHKWRPSTNRAKHLFTCPGFASDPAWNDAKFQKDRSAYMEAQAHKKQVCCRDTHAAYGRWFKEYLSAPCVPYWTLICLVLAGQQP